MHSTGSHARATRLMFGMVACLLFRQKVGAISMEGLAPGPVPVVPEPGPVSGPVSPEPTSGAVCVAAEADRQDVIERRNHDEVCTEPFSSSHESERMGLGDHAQS